MPDASAKEGILETALFNFKETAARLKLAPELVNRLATPKEKIEISCHPVISGGRHLDVHGILIRHNDDLGPSKGGIRMTRDVTVEDVTGLAMEMTWKTALIGVPFGGGKSGIRVDARELTPVDKEIVIRAFVRSAMRHIGPEIYVPAPDMGTTETDMGHIRDCISYSTGISITRGCFVTGKPVILGGIVGRKSATGKGVVFSIAAACRRLGLDIRKMRVAVQGCGNVGSWAALEAVEQGARVVAMSDLSGCVADPDGLDPRALLQHFASKGHLREFSGGSFLDKDAIFGIDCDVLIPAAAGSQITERNADRIRARMIAEGANAPTTPGGNEMLEKRGVFIIPDILCNAGGVYVSYLEYTQETQREQMTVQAVEGRLRQAMEERVNEVFDYAAARRLSMRAGAMDMAVTKVVNGIVARGFLP